MVKLFKSCASDRACHLAANAETTSLIPYHFIEVTAMGFPATVSYKLVDVVLNTKY